MALINTVHGPVDETLLLPHKQVKEDAVYRVTTIEYCVRGCRGEAHRSNVPDAPEFFCHLHVHRSVDNIMKTWPHGMGIIAGL